MTEEEELRTYRLQFWLTASIGVLGFVLYFALASSREALAFLLGAAVSAGNLWLFHRLARSISPGDAPRKPWQASAFAARYLIFFAFGYAIVKALGVNPLAVVLGLFASTAAVLITSVVEAFRSSRRID